MDAQGEMGRRAEMARIVTEELKRLIQPVRLMSLNVSQEKGEVSGRFRSNELLFDYTISGGEIRYKPIGDDAAKARSDGILDRAAAVVPAAKPINPRRTPYPHPRRHGNRLDARLDELAHRLERSERKGGGRDR